MHHQKYIFLTTLLLLIITTASAQFSLSIQDNKVTNEISTFWNINLAYTGAKESEELQLKLAVVNDNEKSIYEVLSPYILLSNKGVKLLTSDFTIAQTITNEMANSTLPNGRYEVVYRENKSNKLLKSRHFTVNGEVVTFSGDPGAGKFDVKKVILTTGSGRLTTAFSNPKGFQTEQKDFYSRLELNPTIVFMGQIPVSALVLLTTEQDANKQHMNQFSINFDYNYFKTLQEEKALAKIDALKDGGGLGELNDLKDKFIHQKNKGLDDLKTKLSSDVVKDKLAKADKYAGLEKQKDNLKNEIDQGSMDKLKRRYDVSNMAELEAKKSEIPSKDYNELKFQLTTSDAYADAQSQMKNLEGAKKEGKKLLEQKDKLESIENTDFMTMMRDPKYNRAILDKLGMNSTPTKLIGSLKSFNTGTCYPLYSELTMNGVRSTGFHIELNPSIVYAAFTKGIIQDEQFDTSFNRFNFQRRLIGGRFGLGKKNGTHLFLSCLNTLELGNPFTPPKNDYTFNPGNNLIGGAEVQVSLFKKHFVTQAEFNDALLTPNINAIGTIPEDIGSPQAKEFLNKIKFKQNYTTHVDYAYNLRSEIRMFHENTILSGAYSYIGPGYISYTAPFLQNDLLKYEGKLSQSIWKKRISFGGFYNYATDDLYLSKAFKTTVSGYGAEASVSIPKLPSIWGKYLPVSQVSDFTDSGQVGRLASNMTMLGSQWNFNLLNISFSSQVLCSQYDITNEFWGTNIQMLNVMIVQNMAFKNGMNWSANGFYNSSKYAQTQEQKGFSVTEMSIIKRTVITGFEIHSLQQGTSMSKTGAVLNLGIKLFKNINTQVRVTYNEIKSPVLGDRRETFGTLVVNAVW